MSNYKYRLLYAEFDGITGEAKFSLAPGERIVKWNSDLQDCGVNSTCGAQGWYCFVIVERPAGGLGMLLPTDEDFENLRIERQS